MEFLDNANNFDEDDLITVLAIVDTGDREEPDIGIDDAYFAKWIDNRHFEVVTFTP